MEPQSRSFTLPSSGRVNPIIAKPRSDTNLSTKAGETVQNQKEPEIEAFNTKSDFSESNAAQETKDIKGKKELMS